MKHRLDFELSNGFLPAQKEDVVRLFWAAFKGKLYRIMAPEEKALGFLRMAVDDKYAISASTPEGRLLGVAGFKTNEGAFIGGSVNELRQHYGNFGGIWRGLILALLERPVQANALLMDGIFVTKETRGQGIGTALLSAIKAEARSRNLTQVRLDVIDSNKRAKALYEREGFIATETTSLGLLRYIFNFSGATTMICQLDQEKKPAKK